MNNDKNRRYFSSYRKDIIRIQKIMNELSTDELASVQHCDKYEVQKGKVRLQEYEVTIKINNFNTTITNKVIKQNEYELTKKDVIDISLFHVNQLSSKFTSLDEPAVIECKKIRIEKG